MKMYIFLLLVFFYVSCQNIEINKNFKKASNSYLNDDFDSALFYVNLIIEIDSSIEEAYLFKSDIYLSLKDTNCACIEIKKFMNIVDSNHIKWKNALYFYQKYCIGLSIEEYFEKLHEYNKNIALNPDDTLAIHKRGNLYFNYDSIDNAIKDYTSFLIIAESPIIYYNRALCYLKIGEKEKACYDVQKAMEYNYKPVYNLLIFCE